MQSDLTPEQLAEREAYNAAQAAEQHVATDEEVTAATAVEVEQPKAMSAPATYTDHGAKSDPREGYKAAVVAAEDHKTAAEDHQRAEDDHTRAEKDHDAVNDALALLEDARAEATPADPNAGAGVVE